MRRWAAWLGGLALALGGIFLVKYSIDQGYFGPVARVTAGLLLGLVLLGFLALAGVFAEVIASPAPILAAGPGGLAVLPGVVHAQTYANLTRADVERLHERDAALWPLVRYGPTTPCEIGPYAPAGADHPLGTDAEGRDLQLKRLSKVKAERDSAAVQSTLAELSRAAEGTDNLMHKLIDCANAYCTVGEMVSALKGVWGEFQQPVVF